jgi:hypothetical protein
MRMADRPFLHALVNLDLPGKDALAAIERAWLEGVTGAVLPGLWQRALRGDPGVDSAITVVRDRNSPIRAKDLTRDEWLSALESLVDGLENVNVSVGDENVTMQASASRSMGGGVALEALATLLPDSNAHTKWIELLLAVLADADPAFGKVSDDNAGAVHTTLDVALLRPADESVRRSRELLRGYSWLTVVPKELVQRLGGVDAMASTGAIDQVYPLAGGGAVLRATPTPADFDDAAMRRLFRLLAPVLPPGEPKRPWLSEGLRLIYQDATSVRP